MAPWAYGQFSLPVNRASSKCNRRAWWPLGIDEEEDEPPTSARSVKTKRDRRSHRQVPA